MRSLAQIWCVCLLVSHLRLFKYCVEGLSFSLRENRPFVRIFLLVGDDNVEGYASLTQLHELATNNNTRETYGHLLKPDGKHWRPRHDVFVTYDHSHGGKWLSGKLKAEGFGANSRAFGPELGFGHALGELYDDPVIIIKAGWSGRTLEKDFRPPSRKAPAGFQFLRLKTSIQRTISNLENILGPDYHNARHQIAGMVWWHGYSEFSVPKAVEKYAGNLENLIKSVQSEIKLFLPVAVAELGGQGTANVSAEELAFRRMQMSVVDHPLFARTVVYVPTSPYVTQASDHDLDTYKHYYGRADTMYSIGQALAIALAAKTTEGAQKLTAMSDRAEISSFQLTSTTEIYMLLAMALVATVISIGVYVQRTYSERDLLFLPIRLLPERYQRPFHARFPQSIPVSTDDDGDIEFS